MAPIPQKTLYSYGALLTLKWRPDYSKVSPNETLVSEGVKSIDCRIGNVSLTPWRFPEKFYPNNRLRSETGRERSHHTKDLSRIRHFAPLVITQSRPGLLLNS